MPSTFLQLVNRVNRKVNEVELTSSNFASSSGFYNTAKDAVNDAISRINQDDFMWPFNHTTYDETLVAGDSRYDFQTDCKFPHMDTFRIQRDDSLNVETKYLNETDYIKYLKEKVDDEYNSTTSIRDVPKIVARRPDEGYIVWPRPDEAYTLTYEYYKLPIPLSDWDDEPTVPSQFDHIIQEGAMVYVYDFRGDTATADRSNVRFEEKLDNMRRIYINRYEYIWDTRVHKNTSGQTLRLDN